MSVSTANRKPVPAWKYTVFSSADRAGVRGALPLRLPTVNGVNHLVVPLLAYMHMAPGLAKWAPPVGMYRC